MIETHKTKVNWNWDEPCHPVARIGTMEAANLAQMMTLRRCHYCRAEVVGPHGQSAIEQHQQAMHPGEPSAYTVYPPTMSVEPRGRG